MRKPWSSQPIRHMSRCLVRLNKDNHTLHQLNSSKQMSSSLSQGPRPKVLHHSTKSTNMSKTMTRTMMRTITTIKITMQITTISNTINNTMMRGTMSSQRYLFLITKMFLQMTTQILPLMKIKFQYILRISNLCLLLPMFPPKNKLWHRYHLGCPILFQFHQHQQLQQI